MSGVYESPIEKMLGEALCSLDVGTLGFALHVQFPVPPYRLDFAFVAKDHRLVVEVDGHEYHNRTKTQAEHDRCRDRALTLQGWRVVRFAGSEVYAAPVRCAQEVLLHLKHLSAEKSSAALTEAIAKRVIRLTRENAESASLVYQRKLDRIFAFQDWKEASPGVFSKAGLLSRSRRELVRWLNENTALAKRETVSRDNATGSYFFRAGGGEFHELVQNEEYLTILEQKDQERR